ncbi:MAG TPA: hypothetical protein VKI18_04915 [Albitalea sp.]|nr:hypothetical protein [Albitalea sp.]
MLAMPALGLAAAPLAVVTILDGDAPLLVRDASKLSVAEGVRLSADDIVESGDKTRLLRIEFNDGTILDLGPRTRLLLAPRMSGGKRPAKAYLMQGFAKLTAAKAAPAAATLASPALDISGLSRDVVLLVLPDESYVFAESGEVSIAERAGGKEIASHKLKSGDFYARSGDNKSAVTARPTQAFIQRLPRPFLDTLPSRAELYKTRQVEPKPLGAIAYADVQPWIDAEAALRPGFVTRWRAQARNPEFRKGLVAQIAAHPEWDRTLFPEKYLPKPPSAPNPNSPFFVLPSASKPYR